MREEEGMLAGSGRLGSRLSKSKGVITKQGRREPFCYEYVCRDEQLMHPIVS